MFSERPLAIIWSTALLLDGKQAQIGIWPSRILYAYKSPIWAAYGGYLGPGNIDQLKPNDPALVTLNELESNYDQEIRNNSVLKIILVSKPGIFDDGVFRIVTMSGDIELEVRSYAFGVNVDRTLEIATASILRFAPDRFYDGKSGVLMVDVITKALGNDKRPSQKASYRHRLYSGVIDSLKK